MKGETVCISWSHHLQTALACGHRHFEQAPNSLRRPDLAISSMKLFSQFYTARKSQSSTSVPWARTQPLPIDWPTKCTRQQTPPSRLGFQASSYHFHVLVYALFTQSFHKSYSILLKCFYAKRIIKQQQQKKCTYLSLYLWTNIPVQYIYPTHSHLGNCHRLGKTIF